MKKTNPTDATGAAPGGENDLAPDPVQNDAGEPDGADAAAMGGDELSTVKAQRDELFERVARVTAEFQNSRRRLESEFRSKLEFANADLIKVLLPVIDNFERAMAVDPAKTDAASILKGLQAVHDQWLTVLKNQNVEEIAPEPGTPFDPNLHEAVMQQPSDKYPEQTVLQLLQKGYSLHGRRLRPASVVVSKPA
jgi:molecular chaperone GrpE